MRLNVKLNTKRNIVFGIINKVILMILPLVAKTYIKTYLGSSFLGLSSLYSSVLQVLMLSELGISSALVYHMLKPVAENDFRTINALLKLYKKAYFYIGLVVVTIGAIVSLFLPALIKGEYPEGVNIYSIYFIQLFNSALSFFLFGYRQCLLVAYQREDVNSLVNLLTQICLQVIQIVILKNTRNYYRYILATPVFTIINNIWIAYITRKLFPDAVCEGKLCPEKIHKLKESVAGTFIQKFCAVTRNSLDSIYISAFLGLTVAGIYNNYYYIFIGITGLFNIIVTSLAGGIGNHVVLKSKTENFNELKILDFLYMNVSGWVTVCMLCCFQPFMKLWMGDDMLLPYKSVVLLCVYFYLLKMGDIRSLYSTANGLWWKNKLRAICETGGNIILNTILGILFGVNGIILATIISLFFLNFIWSSSILFFEYFGKEKLKDYFCYHAEYIAFTIVLCILSFGVTSRICYNNQLSVFVLRGIVCSGFFVVFFVLFYGRTDILKDSINMLKR